MILLWVGIALTILCACLSIVFLVAKGLEQAKKNNAPAADPLEGSPSSDGRTAQPARDPSAQGPEGGVNPHAFGDRLDILKLISDFVVALGISMIGNIAISAIVGKLYDRLMAKMSSHIARFKNFVSTSVNSTIKSIARMSPDVLAKYGDKFATMLKNSKVAATVAKFGAKAGTTALRMLKPPTLLDIAMLAFDIMDFIDVKGYQTYLLNKHVESMKDPLLLEWQTIRAQSGIVDPEVIGPIDYMSPDKMTEIIRDIVPLLVKDSYLIELIADVMKKDKNDVELIIESEDDVADLADIMFELRPLDDIPNNVMKYLCISEGGKLVKVSPNGPLSCSFPTKEACDASWEWDWKENTVADGSIYAIWDDRYKACIKSPGHLIRSTCEENKGRKNWRGRHGDPQKSALVHRFLPDGRERMNCDNDHQYCSGIYGMSREVTSNPPYEDCKLSTWQAILETVFGTTIVRMIKGAQGSK
jgi:hypothetical protein